MCGGCRAPRDWSRTSVEDRAASMAQCAHHARQWMCRGSLSASTSRRTRRCRAWQGREDPRRGECGDEGRCGLRDREDVLSLVLGEGRWKGDGAFRQVASAQPCDFGPTLAGEDAQLYDRAEGIADAFGRTVHRGQLVIRQDTVVGHPLDGLHTVAWRMVHIVSAQCPAEENLDGGERVVLFGYGAAEAIDPLVDQLRGDVGESLLPEGEVAVQELAIVSHCAGPVLLLARVEEDSERFVPGDRLRSMRAERVLGQDTLRFGSDLAEANRT